jgi:hypothetical protein
MSCTLVAEQLLPLREFCLTLKLVTEDAHLALPRQSKVYSLAGVKPMQASALTTCLAVSNSLHVGVEANPMF